MRDQHRNKRGLVHENTDLRKQVADLKRAAVERRRVEDGLRHDRELLRMLLNQAPHPLCLLTAGGTPLLANRPFLDLLGYSTVGELLRVGGALGLLVGSPPLAEPAMPGQARDVTFRRFDGESLVTAVMASPVPGTDYLAVTVVATPQAA